MAAYEDDDPLVKIGTDTEIGKHGHTKISSDLELYPHHGGEGGSAGPPGPQGPEGPQGPAGDIGSQGKNQVYSYCVLHNIDKVNLKGGRYNRFVLRSLCMNFVAEAT